MTQTASVGVRSLLPLFAAFLVPLPWVALNLIGYDGPPLVESLLAGISILGAAFILSWAAELMQMDVSQAFALGLLALIAVLPEYAVDAVFAYEAGRDPVVAQQGYAVANMTGANRLLIGIGWTSIVILAWIRHGAREITMERSQAVEMAILLIATVYALIIPFKGDLGLLDTFVLVSLFAAYTWAASRAPAEEPHLVGPAATIGVLPAKQRRIVVAIFFLFAAFVIFNSAEPFAHGLVETGLHYGIDEFLLVQWLAPLASEAPEFIVALLFVWRGQASAAMRTLVSSKVNQWTLLIATLPVVFSFGAGHLGGMPMVERQEHEIWLTAAQSFFAIILIADFSMNRWEALLLFGLFTAQLVLPLEIGGIDVRQVFTFLYLALGFLFLFDSRRRAGIRAWPTYIRRSLQRHAPEEMGQPVPPRQH